MIILNNPNKIISKLPVKIPITNIKRKSCLGKIGNQVKLKLIDSIYLEPKSEDIIQTFLHIYNTGGKGIFIEILKNKIKKIISFENPLINKLSESDNELIKIYENMLKSILKSNIIINVVFFINLSSYPIFKNNFNKNLVPIISFTSSFDHYDISLPIPKILDWKEPEEGITFIFDKKKLKESEKNLNSIIYKKILELKQHPYYKIYNMNYYEFDELDLKINKKIKLTKSIVFISDPEVPIIMQLFMNSKTELILIENENYYNYYSKLLIDNIEYKRWHIENWYDNINKSNEKIINGLYNRVIKNNYTIDKIKEKYMGFLEHISFIFNKSNIYVEPFNNFTDLNLNITTQMDYNKFYNLLYNNYNLIRCWSYKLNPYSKLLTKLKTNHNFIPEFIKLCINTLPSFENLHWFSNRRILLENLPKILQGIKEKIKIKNTYNYLIENSDDLLNTKIINNNSSVFYIEIQEKSSKFHLWENDFNPELEIIIQFINNQPNGSSVIIRLYTFELPRTINILKLLHSKFENIKILKNEWFDSYLPYRYFIGINLNKNKNKNNNNIGLDFESYNNIYFSLETQELIKIIKFIKSNSQVNLDQFKNNNLINQWFEKWLNYVI